MPTTATPAPPSEVPASQPNNPGVVPVVPSIEPVAPETVPQVPPAPLAQPDVAPLAPPAPASAQPIVEDSPLPVPDPIAPLEAPTQSTDEIPLNPPLQKGEVTPTPAAAIPEVTTAEIQPQAPIGEMPPAPEAPATETPVESPQSLEAGIASEATAVQQPQPPAPESPDPRPPLEQIQGLRQVLTSLVPGLVIGDPTITRDTKGEHLVLAMTLNGQPIEETAMRTQVLPQLTQENPDAGSQALESYTALYDTMHRDAETIAAEVRDQSQAKSSNGLIDFFRKLFK